MEKLRINNGLKRIEVNDAGECIEFSVTDNEFLRKFAGLIQWISEQDGNIRELQKHQEGVLSGEDGGMNFEALDKALDIRSRILNEAREKIDSTFGDGASRKIFGNIVPDFWAIADFLEQISPLIEKYAKERRAELDSIAKKYDKKYNLNRRGAKSPKPYRAE